MKSLTFLCYNVKSKKNRGDVYEGFFEGCCFRSREKGVRSF